MKEQILPRHFYRRDTKIVAQEILGNILVHKTPQGVLRGMIVEAEAYFGLGDLASHAAKRKTSRNSIMFGRPGVAYIYLNYGLHHLLNVVTEPEGTAGAVLIRALQPLEGKKIMLNNRRVESELELANGPGKLTKALQIDISLNGQNMTSGRLFIAKGQTKCISIKAASRIGVSVAQDALLRYYIEGNPFVSRK